MVDSGSDADGATLGGAGAEAEQPAGHGEGARLALVVDEAQPAAHAEATSEDSTGCVDAHRVVLRRRHVRTRDNRGGAAWSTEATRGWVGGWVGAGSCASVRGRVRHAHCACMCASDSRQPPR
jgi:hypothetical protein